LRAGVIVSRQGAGSGSAETCYITYCSRRKNESAGLLPAVDRYAAPRIKRVRELAASHDARFLIFSGKFGMLKPDEAIPYYDQKLSSSEIPAMALKISGPIGAFDKVVFWVDPLDEIASYLEAVRAAAERVAVELEIRELPALPESCPKP
jgi:hypothetical protein